jgi:hypothetical protein
MSPDHQGYHFGDITRMLVIWFGPAARAVRGQIDWLKFGKALVIGFLATGTMTVATAGGALVGAIHDPRVATMIPAMFGLVMYVIEQARRIMQGQPIQISPPQSPAMEDPYGKGQGDH